MSDVPAVVAVRECFYAPQGEGSRVGEPSIFVRLAGCNLNCHFCDTDWRYGDKVPITAEGIGMLLKRVSARPPTDPHPPRWVTLTGGEPCAAPAFNELVRFLLKEGYSVSVETNGTIWRAALRDCHVVISPKEWWEGDKGDLDPALFGLPRYELKLVVDRETTQMKIVELMAKYPGLTPTHGCFLQPVFEDREAWQRALDICLDWPTWRLSLQTHKWIGTR